MYLNWVRSPSNLGFYRQNQAVSRDIYGHRPSLTGYRDRFAGLGLEFDPKLMALGVGALALGMFLLGGKAAPRRRARKRARLEARRERLSRRIAELGP